MVLRGKSPEHNVIQTKAGMACLRWTPAPSKDLMILFFDIPLCYFLLLFLSLFPIVHCLYFSSLSVRLIPSPSIFIFFFFFLSAIYYFSLIFPCYFLLFYIIRISILCSIVHCLYFCSLECVRSTPALSKDLSILFLDISLLFLTSVSICILLFPIVHCLYFCSPSVKGYSCTLLSIY